MGFPAEAAVFLTAALPILELRGAIPLGFALGLPPQKIFIIALLGNLLPIIPLLLILRIGTEQMRKYPKMDAFFNWLFARTRAKSALVEKMEAAGLALFVAVPLPGTGAWTGCVAATLFNFKLFRATMACFLGVLIAGIIVLSLCGGLTQLLPFLSNKCV